MKDVDMKNIKRHARFNAKSQYPHTEPSTKYGKDERGSTPCLQTKQEQTQEESKRACQPIYSLLSRWIQKKKTSKHKKLEEL